MNKKVWYAPNKFESYGEQEIQAVVDCLRSGINEAKENYRKHYDIGVWRNKIKNIIV